MEGDHPPGGDRDLFTSLGIAPGALGLVTQLEVAEARQLHAVAPLERHPDLLEKALDHVLGFALVQPDLIEQQIGEFGLRQSHVSPLLHADVRRVPLRPA